MLMLLLTEQAEERDERERRYVWPCLLHLCQISYDWQHVQSVGHRKQHIFISLVDDTHSPYGAGIG